MKKLRDLNLNTRQFWNDTYLDTYKRVEYEEDRPFHHVRFERALEDVKDGDKILDIGCGVGNFTKRVKPKYPNCEVWGIDISDEMIKLNNLSDPTNKYIYQKIGNLNQVPDNYFDYVFSGEVLEHLNVPEDLFIDAHRVLKTGGVFVVSTPFENSVDSYEHVWSYSFEDIKQLYLDNGFNEPHIEKLAKDYFVTIYAKGVKNGNT